jgi:hypothetical protein
MKNEVQVLDKNTEVVNKNKKIKNGLITANTTVNVNTGDFSIKMDDNTTKVAITGILGGILLYALKLLKK